MDAFIQPLIEVLLKFLKVAARPLMSHNVFSYALFPVLNCFRKGSLILSW